MISVFPLVSRWIDLRTLFGALTMWSRWSLIGCFVLSASIGFAGENPKDSDVTVPREQVPNFAKDTIDSMQLADEDSTVKLKRIYGKGANGLSGFIDLETTVNSITDEIKNGKPLSADDGKKLLADLKRLTEQMSTLRSRVDQLGQSPLGRLTLLQSRLDEAKLKCVTLVSELGEDHPDVKKAVKEVDILTELIGELAEEQTSEPSRTFIISTQGRSASRLANLLGPLFAETAVISGDDDSGSVMVLVKETVPIPKVPQIQAEIQARIQELKPRSQSDTVPSAARIVHQKDEKDREYELQIQKFVERYRKVENNRERAKLRSQITELTDEQFNHRQARREREFQALADRVNQLRVANSRRLARKEEIIRRRVDELLDPSMKREWDDVEKSPEDSSIPSQASTGPPQTYAVDDVGPRRVYDSAEMTIESRPQATEEATYSGKSVSEWLGVLRRERNSARILEAVNAMSRLRQDIDSNVLVTELLQAIRRLDRSSDTYYEIVRDVIEILPRLVKDRRISADQVAQLVVIEVVNSNGNLATVELFRRFVLLLVPQNAREEKFQSDVNRSLLQAIRSRKKTLIPALAMAAQESQDLQIVVTECVWFILGRDSINEFPSLVEVLRNVCDQSGPRYDSARLLAAYLLANSGLNTSKVWEVVSREAKVALHTEEPSDVRFNWIVRCLTAIGKNVPQAEQGLQEVLEFVVGRIEKNLSKVKTTGPNSYENLYGQLETSLNVLALAPVQAESFVPRIREHLASAKEETAKGNTTSRSLGTPILQLVDDYLELIVVASRDAKSVARSAAQPQPKMVEGQAKPLEGQSAPTEKTYDGVKYSEWLRLLETERKPERLCAAMEAVGQLALEKDVHRIARLIFLAEAGFEQEDQNVSGPVMDAGREALRRLPPPIVFAELAVALGDSESYRSGRNFQAEVIGLVYDVRFKPVFEKNLDEFVKLTTRTLNEEPSDGDAKFLSKIVTVCVEFHRPPKDFPELLSRVRHYFSKGLPANPGTGLYWIDIARWLVQYAPDTPDLKPVLVAQLGKHNLNVIDLLGELTLSGGPDTVPKLIEYFQLLLKKMDERIVKFDRQDNDPDQALRQGRGELVECAEIVKALAMVGENQLAGDFIAMLAKYVPAKSDAFPWRNDLPMNFLFQQIESAQTGVRQFKVAADPNRCQVKLPDFFKLNGYWKLRSDQPRSISIHGMEWSVGDDLRNGEPVRFPISFLWSDTWWAGTPPFQSVIVIVDEGKTPKEIRLIPKNGSRVNARRIEGIYKLAEDNLLIQLARPGTPRPTKFELEDEDAKRDQVQLTLDRETETPSFYVGRDR